jgi:hypothetical protein
MSQAEHRPAERMEESSDTSMRIRFRCVFFPVQAGNRNTNLT